MIIRQNVNVKKIINYNFDEILDYINKGRQARKQMEVKVC